MLTTSEPRWMELLRAEVARTNIAAAAARIGYSRTTISLVLARKYPGKPDKIAAAALAELEPALMVDCPHVGGSIGVAVCQATSSQRAPTHNPTKMHHWRACRQCPHRKEGAIA